MTSALTSRPWLSALCALGALASVGCRDLDKFDTEAGTAYCGAIGLRDFQAGFIPKNQSPNLELQLTLNTARLSSEPGMLRSSDFTNGLCRGPDRALFKDAPLRAIPEVDRDSLSALSFGEGHEHDFFVWVDSSCQGTMLGVVSLMKNGQVELRLFKPARLPPPNAEPAQTPGFAVFQMYKQKGSPNQPEKPCGF